MHRASPSIGKIVGTGILKFKSCLCRLSVCCDAFVGWKIVARGRFSRASLSRFDARLTRPTKGFAPLSGALGARGDLCVTVAYRPCGSCITGPYCLYGSCGSTYSLPMLYQYYRQLPIITVCLWPAYGIGKRYYRG